MMQGILLAVTALCKITLFFLFVYKEWLYISQSFWNFVNPLGHIIVLLSMLGEPVFWAALIIGFFCIFISTKLQEKDIQKTVDPDYDYKIINSENELSDEKCRAITKKGTPCKNRAIENGHCRVHGGV
jgi:hypothetical protein